ncbi:MAG: peptidoglycan DD-metalloendopeptidase family protein [Proteobacteria bacterium]|nr:peptidoglycan DD-metalloendopeptidase family protein [Pseudomonadota bacterium]
MKNRISQAILLCCVVLTLAACSTSRNPAPIVDRTARPEARPAAPIAASGGPRHMDSQGYYTVRKGDTLYQIALEFGQSYRDLVVWNNLASPNDIRVDQVLRVTGPTNAPASGPVQTGSVASASGIEVRPLSTPSGVPGAVVPSMNKTGPRGDKRPYSEATLTELQKPESAVGTEMRPERQKPTEKPPEPVATNGEDAGISWKWPAEGKILGTFSENKKGIDIGGKAGQPVLAASSGKVMYAGSGIRGYGNLVIVKHSNTLLSAYAHNKTLLVKEGQNVNQGDKIAEMGNTDSDVVKLHFEIRQQGKPVDPAKFLPAR